MHRNRRSGFSLIELLVVIVIIGILASIAYPAYQRYVVQTRRSDAQIAIQQIANRLEKYLSYCNTYTTTLTGTWPATCPPEPAGTPGMGFADLLSPDDHYAMTVAADNIGGTCATGPCAGLGAAAAACILACGYTITANPNGAGVTGRQAGNGSLRMDSIGRKQWDRNNNGTYDANENTWK